MDSSGGEFEEGAEAVGPDVEDYRAVGSGPPDPRKFLQGGGSSKTTVRRRVLGDVSSDREEPGRVST